MNGVNMNVKLAVLSAAFATSLGISVGIASAAEPLTNEQMDEVTAGDNQGTVFNAGGLGTGLSSDIVTVQDPTIYMLSY